MIRIILFCFMLLFAVGVRASADSECDGPFKGKRPTAVELSEILTGHDKWVRTNRVHQQTMSWLESIKRAIAEWASGRANLCGADLTKANLSRIDLSGADLRKTKLNIANLKMADLNGADLNGADLSGADLSGANLSGANLSGANLSGANLSGADLSGVEVMPSEEELDLGLSTKTVYLGVTNLSGANLNGTNLAGILFAPKSEMLPDLASFAQARNLDQIQVSAKSVPTLLELRDALKKAGFRDAGWTMNYLIKAYREEEATFLEKWFKRILFNWTCGYGLYPIRGLSILFLMEGFLAFFGYRLLRRPHSWWPGTVPPSKLSVSDQIAKREFGSSLFGCLLIAFGVLDYHVVAYLWDFAPNPAALWVGLGVGGVLLTDYALLQIRVVRGWYGTNAIEAMEIVRFLRENRDEDDSDGSNRKLFRSRAAPNAASAVEVGAVADVRGV